MPVCVMEGMSLCMRVRWEVKGKGGGAVIGTSEAFSPLTLTNHLAVHFVTRAATDSPSCSWTLVWQEGNLVRLWDWGGGVGAGRGIFNTH